MKILIIEDEPVSRCVLANILTDQGHDVRDAWRADDALKVAREFHPELLIADWRLNDKVDGIDVAKQIKQDNPDVHVFLMSAYHPVYSAILEKGLVPDVVLDKPMELNKLVEAIGDTLEDLQSRPGA